MTIHESGLCDIILTEVRTIREILTGNGTPEKGMIVRLDRLEGKAKRATWLVSVLVVALVTAAAEALARLR